jgi:Na+/H+-dicarboxylate symporter
VHGFTPDEKKQLRSSIHALFQAFLPQNTRRMASFTLTRKLKLAIAICFTLGIIVGSLLPLAEPAGPGGDKLHHFLAYGLLMAAWSAALPRHARFGLLPLALVIAMLGLAVEGMQGLTAYRFFDWSDALANALGVVSGWVVMAGWYALRPSAPSGSPLTATPNPSTRAAE